MLTAIASLSLLAALAYYAFFSVRTHKRLPPGPDADENVRGELTTAAVGKTGTWAVFDRWSKAYGYIFSFHMGRTPVLVISMAEAAWDLLEKRGDIYSSRPRLIMAHEIMSGGMRGLSMPYSDHWRKWRKAHLSACTLFLYQSLTFFRYVQIQHTGMSGRASLAYREHQTLESALFLRDLLQNADNYGEIIQRFATSIMLSISYGQRVANLDSEVVKNNYKSVMEFSKAAVTGKYIVESWPFLLWLPRPLQWFRYSAERIRKNDTALYLSLLESVQKRMDAGTNKECMSSRSLTSGREGLSMVELAYAVAAPFGAGIDTTSSSVEFFLIAALLHPSATKKAQAELDAVVGRDRLPTFQDQESLPYIGAFIKEVERWRPVVPLAVPHSVTRDDIYEGYDIPKGATILGSIYSMMKDPEMFPEPNLFHPERFLSPSPGAQDPRFVDFTLPFGFGRRQCPGMHVASQSLYILVTRILWAFDITQAPDAPLPDPLASVSLGLVCAPAPFRFALHPRHMDAVKIIELEATEADVRLKEWD
ncbi:hypothetical protein EW146_g3540 [Bondarzewia mesenterica]|uniref:Cytochrome P450 n=1 Tax=Bondarzewia mesenterica TaxID=1095465 RepID=A0A4V3XFE8_9AGAM|nr:hypothetical protein EW146_g3540 [Bondarzewia mesenterica]